MDKNVSTNLNIAKRSRTKTAHFFGSQDLPKPSKDPKEIKDPNDKYCIRSHALADKGRVKINKSRDGLSGLMIVNEVHKEKVPLKGAHICVCTHINRHNAVLIETFCDFGATISLCSSNVNTIEDEICAALVESGVSVYGWNGESEDDYWWCMEECIKSAPKNPDFIIDDGGDLTNHMMNKYPKIFNNLKGIVETNAFGVYKLYSLLKSDTLLVPAMNITNSVSLEHFMRTFQFRECLYKCFDLAQEYLIAGQKFLICGYGHRGKACAKYLKMMGATVFAAEIDPLCALQACADGIEVMEMDTVLGLVDGIILCTECVDIIGKQIKQVKDNCLIINFGHSQCEINMEEIKKVDDQLGIDTSNHHVTRLVFSNGKCVRILFNGEPVQNVSFPMPLSILSIQTSTIAVSILELNLYSRERYNGGVYLLPKILDEYIARIHLKIYSATLTKLTDHQATFMGVSKDGPFKSQHYRYA